LIGKAHIKRIIEEPQAALAAIVDPTPAARDEAARLGVPWFAELDALLSAARPDGIVLATPNQLHLAGALKTIAAGLPTLLEKPVSETVADAMRIVEASEKAGVPVLIGHHHRSSLIMRKAREIIASGALGRITVANAMCWWLKPTDYFDVAWRREPGGGVILINLVHAIDDLRMLCGDISNVQAVTSNAARGFPVEDTAAILLQFANGALGTLTVSDSAAAPWSWELTSGDNKAYPQTDQSCYMVAGTEGALAVPRLDLWHYRETKSWWVPIECERRFIQDQDPLTAQMQHFCDVVRGTAQPVLNAREGTKTLAATLAVKDAAASGRSIRLS
jgi:predicted dehydrogenase